MQFAHQIKDGFGEFFICRNARCAFVGRNTDWAHALLAGGYKFACPRRGTRYRPFVDGAADRLECNMVWLVRVTDLMAQAMHANELYEGQ
eukprot:528420-Alexandrium_andersonii.AAC.1